MVIPACARSRWASLLSGSSAPLRRITPISCNVFPAYNPLGFVMKRISVVVLILCATFVSVAWGQQPMGKCSNNWSEFHRPNMERWNRVKRCLASRMLGTSA